MIARSDCAPARCSGPSGWPIGAEEAAIPRHGRWRSRLDLPEIRMVRIEEDIAVEARHDGRDAQNGRTALIVPGVAKPSAGRHVVRIPGRHVARPDLLDVDLTRDRDDREDLVGRDSSASQVYEPLQCG